MSRRRRAIALRYDPGRDRAPVVIAKGDGYRADRIRALADQHGILIRDDPRLIEAFARLDEQRPIPPELYSAVAELLATVFRIHEVMSTRRRAAYTADSDDA